MYKRLFVVFIVILIFILGFGNIGFSDDEDIKNILIFQSYAQDFKWTNEFQKGISSQILDSDLKINFQVEYLDTKRNFSKDYIDKLLNFNIYKYKDKDFDLVLAIDNNALEFVIDLKKYILKDVSVIASGINNGKSYNLNKDYYIIEEKINYIKTLNFMKDLNNDLEKIYIIIDKTTTGKKIKREIKQEVKNNNIDELSFEFISDYSIKGITELIDKKDKDIGILFLLYFIDGENNKYNYSSVINHISKDSKIPIFSVWDFYINEGVIGGYLTSPLLYGKITGKTAIDFLKGNQILSYRENLDNYEAKILDYKIYKGYEYYFDKLPQNIKWINKPQSYFEKNKEIIMTFLVIVIILIILIFITLDNLKRQKEINQKNKEMVNIQKELIYTLGDVIETRSGETANHVKRVSKIAEFLAIELGKKNIAEKILITSPLHDLGKIGISDKILKKPGDLTDEEYEKIKKHTVLGYELLNNKKSEILNIAAKIAYQHQEHWNGNGYPQGLAGKNISIYARIVTVADVYDALRSKRVYKEAWEVDKTLDFIKDQKGKMFQPEIADIVLKKYKEIEQIRNSNL
ncbi:MAG: HD domain-containing phosphohydrolase [Bacillota bacterium]